MSETENYTECASAIGGCGRKLGVDGALCAECKAVKAADPAAWSAAAAARYESEAAGRAGGGETVYVGAWVAETVIHAWVTDGAATVAAAQMMAASSV